MATIQSLSDIGYQTVQQAQPQFIQQPQPQQAMPKQSKIPMILGLLAIIFCVIIFLFLVAMVVTYFINNSKTVSNPGWDIYIGNTNDVDVTTDTFCPNGDDIYMVTSTRSDVTINISSSGNLTGRMFMIDNTNNSESAFVRSSGSTITDKINSGTISSGETATYIWTSSNSLKRLF